MTLICTYEINGRMYITEADELCRLRDGFWIDDSGKFCQSVDAFKFIMPHMIKEIRKESENGNTDN